MRGLQAVCEDDSNILPRIRRSIALFDTFVPIRFLSGRGAHHPEIQTQLDFLEEKGLVYSGRGPDVARLLAQFKVMSHPMKDLVELFPEKGRIDEFTGETETDSIAIGMYLKHPLKRERYYGWKPRDDETIERPDLQDYIFRGFCSCFTEVTGVETIAMCEYDLPNNLLVSSATDPQFQKVIRVALEHLPSPTADAAWADIIEFKNEMRDKLWHFRRFLHDLATKKKTEAEIRDDIEWTINQYTNAMKIHNLKAGDGFIEVYVTPAMEIIEDFAKFNWSKIAKGALSVKKRQVELMEAEMKAPGRECAYVFDARKRFGA